ILRPAHKPDIGVLVESSPSVNRHFCPPACSCCCAWCGWCGVGDAYARKKASPLAIRFPGRSLSRLPLLLYSLVPVHSEFCEGEDLVFPDFHFGAALANDYTVRHCAD